MTFTEADDQYFLHQLPRTFDHVVDSAPQFSDRCFFNILSPDAEFIAVTGLGMYPNTQHSHAYAKLSLGDGRHWDIDGIRKVTTDRHDLHAGPIRITCVEPLKRWKLELGPNDSGLEWELEFEARAPLWQLNPLTLRSRGRVLADMQHIKQPGSYTGRITLHGEELPFTTLVGGRDRSIGIRDNMNIDFWVWYEAVFDDFAIEAWVIEDTTGGVSYVDGGITYNDGRQSKSFVKVEHDVVFDGQRRRQTSSTCTFTDEDGTSHTVTGTAANENAIIYYVPGHPEAVKAKGYTHYAWDGKDAAELDRVEASTISTDQFLRYDYDGKVGHGVFELFVAGRRYPRYSNWG